MKKTIIISAIIIVILGFISIRDYNNYFYGRSIVNYHVLPYGLTPYHWKDYTIENGKRVPIKNDFYLLSDSHIFWGPGTSVIPVSSYESGFVIDSITEFVIDSIKCYYYNKDSIYVYCVDEEHNPHWIIPVFHEGWVLFDEIKNVKMESLSTYKCVEIMGTGN